MARTVGGIGTEGERDGAFALDAAFDDGFITLPDGVVLELRLEFSVGGEMPGENHEAGGVHV